MKKVLAGLIAVICVALLEKAPSVGTDVAKLQPMELLRIEYSSGFVTVQTDTGDQGRGKDLKYAFRDLKESAAGEVFLDTADHLLISDSARFLLPQLTQILRPGCAVCIDRSVSSLEDAAKYLDIHKSMVTLGDYRAENKELPILTSKGDKLYLEQSES